MGFFDGFRVGDAISSVIGVGSLFSNPAKQQYKYQTKLNAQAQKYAVENFERELDAQYGLTRDNALLQKEGLQRAGLTTSSMSGDVGSPSAVGSIDTPSAGSAPSGLLDLEARNIGVQSLLAVEKNVRENRVAGKQADLIEAQATQTNIDNMSRDLLNRATIEQKMKSGDMSESQGKYLLSMLDFNMRTMDDRVKQQYFNTLQSDYEQQLAAAKVDFQNLANEGQRLLNGISEQQLKKVQFEVEHQQELYDMNLKKIVSEIHMNEASASASFASAALMAAQKAGQELENKLTEAKVPYAKQIANLYVRDLKNRVNLGSRQVDIAKYQVKQEKFKTEHQEQAYYWSNINSTINAVGSFVGNVIPVGKVGKLLNSVGGASSGSSYNPQAYTGFSGYN